MAKKTAAKKRPAPKKAAKKPAAKKAAAPKRKKDGRPAQWWPALSPYLTVRDGQASIQFYARAFGFETYGEVMRGDDGHVQHAGMRLGEAAIMFGPEEGSMGLRVPTAGTPDTLTLYVYVPDVDQLAERAKRGGASVVQAPTDQFWRDRTAVFKDPDGYHWTFATHLG
jgi:PhnB protein